MRVRDEINSGCRARREERRLVILKQATSNNAMRVNCFVPMGCSDKKPSALSLKFGIDCYAFTVAPRSWLFSPATRSAVT
jgi:hypothetical protein